jgi:predicted RNA-binding Zn ribbon-like protein
MNWKVATTEAPGRLELVRGFVNSIDLEQGLDPLTAPDHLAEWCQGAGVCRDTREVDLDELRRFREALRDVLETHAGNGDEAAAWQALEPFAGAARYRLRITGERRPALQPEGSGAGAVIAELFAIVYDAIGAGTWRRLKACRKHSCRYAFYDRSKNGSGAWCDMSVCGNRVKAQRRRQRQKAD